MGNNLMEKVGALWASTDKNNQEYFYGSLELTEAFFAAIEGQNVGAKINILAFVNNFKEEDKHPDFQLFLQPDRQAQPRSGYQRPNSRPQNNGNPAAKKPYAGPQRGGQPVGKKSPYNRGGK